MKTVKDILKIKTAINILLIHKTTLFIIYFDLQRVIYMNGRETVKEGKKRSSIC